MADRIHKNVPDEDFVGLLRLHAAEPLPQDPTLLRDIIEEAADRLEQKSAPSGPAELRTLIPGQSDR